MPTGKLLVDETIEEKTWPLNLEQKKPKPIDPSVVP